jgi:hypothetical protein
MKTGVKIDGNQQLWVVHMETTRQNTLANRRAQTKEKAAPRPSADFRPERCRPTTRATVASLIPILGIRRKNEAAEAAKIVCQRLLKPIIVFDAIPSLTCADGVAEISASLLER